jgi:ABC-type polysaccharide/polyol phosphate transport system ATPase subunit
VPADLVLSVEGLAKRYSPVHTHRYTPTRSIFSRFLDRDDALLVDVSGGGEVDDDDDVDDDEEEEDAPDVDDESESAADFEGLSFRVDRGEAIGVVATPPPAARMVAYVLSGMTAPWAGRAVVHGRVGPTVRLANTFIRREPTPQRAAATLARLMGISFADRSVYIDEVLRLALSDGEALRGLPAGRLLRRVAIAGALDPFADLLVLDELPALGSPAFRQACIRRLEDRLAQGAAAVVATNDAQLIQGLCGECIWLDGGRPQAVGDAKDVLAAYAARVGGARPRRLPRAFNQDAAILSATAAARTGGAEVQVQLEVAPENAAIVPRLILVADDGDEHKFPKPPPFPVPPGRVSLEATLAAGMLPAGRYSVRAAVDVVVGERRSTIYRDVGSLDLPDGPGASAAAVTWSYGEASAERAG